MPRNPNSPPPTKIANMTQKLARPLVSPRIFGPKILPSNCCKPKIRIMKYSACIGLSSTGYTFPGDTQLPGYATLHLGETEDVFTLHSQPGDP